MSVKIYHGKHGSYKTASSVDVDTVNAAKAGRVIVTNVRGMTADRFHDLFDDLPSSFDVINIQRDSEENLHKIQTFWHWVPDGAFMVWDEAQLCFPKSMNQSHLDSLAYKTLTIATQEGRPHTWNEAWDMERHNNYDIILTTPSIKKIRDDIRENAEMAVKHKNQATFFGMLYRGKYLQSWHDPVTNGQNISDFYQSVQRKMTDESNCWKLFDSTKTGKHQESVAGFNFFKSPKLVVSFVLILCAVLFLFRKGRPEIMPNAIDNKSAKTVQTASNTISPPDVNEVLQVDTQNNNTFMDNARNYVPKLKSDRPIDIVKQVREEAILTGCISTEKECYCYTKNYVKLEVNFTYCNLIQKSGFYAEKPVYVVEESTDTPIEKIKDALQGDFSLSPTTLEGVYDQQALNNELYFENVQSRQQPQQPIKGIVTAPYQ